MSWIVIVLGALLALFSLRRLILVAAGSQRFARDPATGSAEPPTVTIVVPAHDEAVVAPSLLAALGRISYPADRLSFVFVCDGCRDGTGDLFRAWSVDRSNSVVIELGSRGGKARALNAGLAASHGDLVVVLDADLRPREDFLRRLVPAFADARVAAAAALILPTNSERSLVARYSALAALVHQLATSAGKDRLDLNPPTCGATAFRRQPILSIGGFLDSPALDDIEVTVALSRAGWRTRFVPGAIAENYVVETLADYWRQHVRWTHGILAARNRRPLSQEASPARRVEGLLMVAGNADRVVFALAVILAVLGTMPAWVPVAYLVFPALEIGVALARAGALRSLHRYLVAAALVFPVDIAASSAGVVLRVLGRAPRWISPERMAPSADGR